MRPSFAVANQVVMLTHVTTKWLNSSFNWVDLLKVSSDQFSSCAMNKPIHSLCSCFFVIYVFVFYVGLLIVRLSFVSDIVFYWSVDSAIDCIVSIYSAV